jgi:Domain of unknown function (DUF6458)
MKTGAGLALIAVGAILAFAVNSTPSGFNINIAGWVLMIVGVVGLVLPMRTYGWLGRRVVRRSYTSPPVQQTQQYTAPPAQALEAGQPTRPTLLDQDDDLIEPTATHRPTTEVVEDIYEQP